MAADFTIVYLFGTPMELVAENVVRPLRRGRPASTGVYGEPVKIVRVPVSLLPDLLSKMESLKAQVASQRPSDDNPFFTSSCLDISRLVILPSATSTYTPADQSPDFSDSD